MVSHKNLGESVGRWASGQTSIRALVQIGSRLHDDELGIEAPDCYSDWDFQVVTDNPEVFRNANWIKRLGLGQPHAYADREGRLGTARKITVILEPGVLDIVVIPLQQLRSIVQQISSGKYTSNLSTYNALIDQATVLKGGYRFIKGLAEFGKLFHFIANEISPRRLDDAAVCNLANGFVCDYISTCNKIARTESLAAQRWLHLYLAELNFQLLHELRQRAENPTYPDARRLELLLDEDWIRAIEVNASPNAKSLRAAVEKSRGTLCRLVRELVGAKWRWPNLGPRPAR